MARKIETKNVSKKVSATPVRQTSLPPRAASPVKAPISHEQIAKRAYEIFISGKGGSAVENWLRAERELRGS